ncbi:MAG: hypothetical protein AAFO76_14895 [Cyanobacteria bacterium J06607_15]
MTNTEILQIYKSLLGIEMVIHRDCDEWTPERLSTHVVYWILFNEHSDNEHNKYFGSASEAMGHKLRKKVIDYAFQKKGMTSQLKEELDKRCKHATK